MSCPLRAQDRPEPRLWNIDVTPHIGIRTNMSFVAEPGADGTRPHVSFGSSPSRGVAVGVRYNDEDLIEFRWSRQDTKVNITGAIITPVRASVLIDQFHMDCSHEYVLPEWPAWARPFVIGSVGVTRATSTGISGGFTRFSFGIGGGIKAFPSPHFGFKFQAQWLPVWVQPEVQAVCGFGCVIRLTGQLASQGEVMVGPVIRF